MVPQRLYRSRTDRMICGVSGGLATYFGVDTTIVRLFLVVATIFTGGMILLVYVVACLLIPDEPSWFSTAPPAGGAEFGASSEASATGETNPGFGTTGGTSGFGSAPTYRYTSEEHHRHRQHWFGWALIALGALILMSKLGLWSWLHLELTWPLFLVLAGLLLLMRHRY